MRLAHIYTKHKYIKLKVTNYFMKRFCGTFFCDPMMRYYVGYILQVATFFKICGIFSN